MSEAELDVGLGWVGLDGCRGGGGGKSNTDDCTLEAAPHTANYRHTPLQWKSWWSLLFGPKNLLKKCKNCYKNA